MEYKTIVYGFRRDNMVEGHFDEMLNAAAKEGFVIVGDLACAITSNPNLTGSIGTLVYVVLSQLMVRGDNAIRPTIPSPTDPNVYNPVVVKDDR